MPINVDGVVIQECAGVTTDNNIMDIVNADVIEVYKNICCVPGSETFSVPGTHTWVVPSGVTSIELCMIGGGGSGSAQGHNPNYEAGGGYSGDVIGQTVVVNPDTSITIVVGTGGAPVSGVAPGFDGLPGTESKFGAISASGGLGGDTDINIQTTTGYKGAGASRSGCWGTTYDGNKAGNNLPTYGGQAGFGNGGDHGCSSSSDFNCTAPYPAGNGGVGAGGGAMLGGSNSGAGGNGEVRISWDCT